MTARFTLTLNGVPGCSVELDDEQVAALRETLWPGDLPAEASRSQWLSIDQASEYLPVSKRTLERAIRAGRIVPARIGRRVLLRRDDLDRFIGAMAGEDVAPTTPPRRRTAG